MFSFDVRICRQLVVWAPAILIGCSSGNGDDGARLPPTDVALDSRYEILTTVTTAGPDCVIGGFRPRGAIGEVVVDQQGRSVSWSQRRVDGGELWSIAGHICDADDSFVVRLRGAVQSAIGDGDDYCLAVLHLAEGDFDQPRNGDRCADPDPSVVELTPGACGQLRGEFTARLRFVGDRCGAQGECALGLRWVARPVGADCTDGGMTPLQDGGSDFGLPDFGAPPLDGSAE